MSRRHQLAFLFLLAGLSASPLSRAELTVAPIFADDMVLQWDAPVPVFGNADPGAVVTVTFDGTSWSTHADESGAWQVNLGPLQASDPSSLMVSDGLESIYFAGVKVGEVWFCSGQSNMGWPLSSANGGAEAIADAGNFNIALFRMTAGSGPDSTTWQVASAATAGSFSAVCYWMGQELGRWFGDVPIGLIQATHDGTAIDRWQHSSGGIGDDYDAMVRAIQPYAVRGVLWYQGESNGGDAGYAVKLTNMINEWRGDWGQETLPFGIVQLAYRSGWNVARNAQLEVADTVGDAFLVVIRDLPGGALHPPEKQPVGIRAAIGARGSVYGEDITWSGPIRDIANSYADGDTAVLRWKHVGGGLFTDDGLAPGEFKLAGTDGRFKSATAIIVGDTVEVRSLSVSAPVKVQYSYRSVGNLYNDVDVVTGDGVVDRLKASEFEITLNASPGNRPPVAAFSYSTNGLSASLDASNSLDPDGVLTGYHWDFGDGGQVSGQAQVQHSYDAAGSYTVTLTVTDDAGATGQAAQTITVSDPGEPATSVHVSSLTAYAEGVGRGYKRGVASVVVRDELGSPVAGAKVTVQFSGTISGPVAGQTDSTGTAELATTQEAKGAIAVDACVVAVEYEPLVYVPNTTACAP